MAQTDAEKKLIRQCERDYDSSKEKFASKFEKFKEFEQAYYSYLSNETNPWKSRIFDPESFEKVERMSAHVVATPPRGTFLPQEASDTFVVAVADQLFKYQWGDPKQAMFKKLMDMVKTAGIFGTAFGLLEWMWDRREFESLNGKNKTKFVQLWDGPLFKVLDPRDVLPDPSATNDHSMQWVIINQYFTIEELEAQNAKFANGESRYKNLGVLKSKLKNKQEYTASRDSHLFGSDSIKGREGDVSVKNRILVRTKYSRDRWVSWCPDWNILIEDHPNPYEHYDLPVHILIDQNIPNQIYGIGEIEPILPLQKGLNSVINQRLDNVRLIMNGMFKVRQNAMWAHTYKSEPGAKWVVSDMGDVEPMTIPDVTGNMFLSTVNFFKNSIDNAVGNTDVLSKSMLQGGVKSATEINLANEEQNARTRAKENFLDMFINRLCTQWMQLNQQFLTTKQLVRVVGAEAVMSLQSNPNFYDETGEIRSVAYKGKDVPKLSVDSSKAFAFMVYEPADIRGAFDFVSESGSTAMNNQSRALENTITAVNLLGQLQPVLQMEGKQIAFTPLLNKVITQLVPTIKNPEEIIKPMAQQNNNLLDQLQYGQEEQGLVGGV